MTLTPFAIQSPTAMTKYGADKGHLTADGGFVADGTYGTLHPAGTGQFKFSSWKVGDKLEIVRNDSYWGKKANLRRVIFRPIADNAARLQALQTGEVDGTTSSSRRTSQRSRGTTTSRSSIARRSTSRT